jgi:hypothetical protein
MVLSDEQQKEAPEQSGVFFCTCLQFNLKPPRSYPDAPEVPRWWSGIRMAYMEAYSKKAVQALDHIAKEDCQSVIPTFRLRRTYYTPSSDVVLWLGASVPIHVVPML